MKACDCDDLGLNGVPCVATIAGASVKGMVVSSRSFLNEGGDTYATFAIIDENGRIHFVPHRAVIFPNVVPNPTPTPAVTPPSSA